MQNSIPSVVILISGRGSNLNALIDHAKQTGAYQIRAVISNRPAAAGLALAQSAGIDTAVLDHTEYESREAFDAALAALVDQYQPGWVVLAGFMRVLTEGFVNRYLGRLVNIHPSLLPAFPGLKTHQQAIDAGVRVHGVTVHLVTPELPGYARIGPRPNCGPGAIAGTARRYRRNTGCAGVGARASNLSPCTGGAGHRAN